MCADPTWQCDGDTVALDHSSGGSSAERRRPRDPRDVGASQRLLVQDVPRSTPRPCHCCNQVLALPWCVHGPLSYRISGGVKVRARVLDAPVGWAREGYAWGGEPGVPSLVARLVWGPVCTLPSRPCRQGNGPVHADIEPRSLGASVCLHAPAQCCAVQSRAVRNVAGVRLRGHTGPAGPNWRRLPMCASSSHGWLWGGSTPHQ